MGEAGREPLGAAGEALARCVHGEAELRGAGRHRGHRVIDARNHRSLDAVGTSGGGTHEARADHPRVVVRYIRDEQRPGRATREARREAPALDAREGCPAGVELADRHARSE